MAWEGSGEMGAVDWTRHCRVSSFVRTSSKIGCLAPLKSVQNGLASEAALSGVPYSASLPVSQNRLRIGRNRVVLCLVDRGGTRDITRSFNTFSIIHSSMREAHLTRLASGAICVPLWRFCQEGSLNRVNRH